MFEDCQQRAFATLPSHSLAPRDMPVATRRVSAVPPTKHATRRGRARGLAGLGSGAEGYVWSNDKGEQQRQNSVLTLCTCTSVQAQAIHRATGGLGMRGTCLQGCRVLSKQHKQRCQRTCIPVRNCAHVIHPILPPTSGYVPRTLSGWHTNASGAVYGGGSKRRAGRG